MKKEAKVKFDFLNKKQQKSKNNELSSFESESEVIYYQLPENTEKKQQKEELSKMIKEIH